MTTKNISKSLLIALSLVALLPATARAQSSTGAARLAAFAGSWRLDLKESYLGSQHVDPDYIFTKTFALNGTMMVQKDHEVNVNVIGFTAPERNLTTELIPDGKEHASQTHGFLPDAPPVPIQVSVTWQGDNLVVTEFGWGGSVTTRRYFLSGDGAQLNELVIGHSTQGDSEQRLVFTRASAS